MASSFPSNLLAQCHYSVCGLGRNGTAVVQALLDLGATVDAWDDNAPKLPATLKNHSRLTYAPLTDLHKRDALILSPGIPHHRPTPHPAAILARSQNVPILSDAELLWQVVRKAGSKARFVSITGTNGKSTTTALLSHILRHAGLPVATGGNIGTAALALPLLGDDGVYVIEMSSYMLERLHHYHATAAAYLNLTPDHMERHGDMARYATAKAHVFDNMGPGDLAVLGEVAEWSKALLPRLKKQGVSIMTLDCHTAISPAEAPALPGRHNAQNIATCHAISRHLDVDDDTIRHAVQSFGGLEHRLQRVAEYEGISFINDSKATNAEATAHALAAYDKVIWIAGGTAKAGGIASLAPLFSHIGHALLIGSDAPLLARTLAEHAVPFTLCHTLQHAVPQAVALARTLGVSTVLLSPACASFDQFKNFEERGELFTRYVQKCIHVPHHK